MSSNYNNLLIHVDNIYIILAIRKAPVNLFVIEC